jgi:hypothetical protein
MKGLRVYIFHLSENIYFHIYISIHPLEDGFENFKLVGHNFHFNNFCFVAKMIIIQIGNHL